MATSLYNINNNMYHRPTYEQDAIDDEFAAANGLSLPTFIPRRDLQLNLNRTMVSLCLFCLTCQLSFAVVEGFVSPVRALRIYQLPETEHSTLSLFKGYLCVLHLDNLLFSQKCLGKCLGK